MPPESMVDALVKIGHHLKPDGVLVDTHPHDTTLPLHVRVGSHDTQVGQIDVESKFVKYRSADEAINTVVKLGLYSRCQHTTVDYFVYFDSIEACQQYLDEEWRSAKLSEVTWSHIATALAPPGERKQIYYCERVCFYVLQPLISAEASSLQQLNGSLWLL